MRRMLVPLSQELFTEIREKVFGPCTVVGETMDNDDIEKDIIDYVDRYANSLTFSAFRDWLDLRLIVECHDRWPEDPFDRTDEQIKKRIQDETDFKREMKFKFRDLCSRLQNKRG
jgi:hypothetical protein